VHKQSSLSANIAAIRSHICQLSRNIRKKSSELKWQESSDICVLSRSSFSSTFSIVLSGGEQLISLLSWHFSPLSVLTLYSHTHMTQQLSRPPQLIFQEQELHDSITNPRPITILATPRRPVCGPGGTPLISGFFTQNKTQNQYVQEVSARRHLRHADLAITAGKRWKCRRGSAAPRRAPCPFWPLAASTLPGP